MSSPFSFTISVLALLALVSPSVQQTEPTVSWFSPPGAGAAGDFNGNWIINQGDVFNIAFQTPATMYDIVIWQNGIRSPYTIATNVTTSSYNWTVDTSGFNVPITPHGDIAGNVCYFGLTNLDGNASWFATSHYVNITSPLLSSYYATATTAKPTGTPAASPDTVTGMMTTTVFATPKSTSDASPLALSNENSDANTSSVSSSQAVGIGLGVAIGVLALAALGAFLLYRRKKQQLGLQRIDSMTGQSTRSLDKMSWRQISNTFGSSGGPAQGPPGPQGQQGPIGPPFGHRPGGDMMQPGGAMPMGPIGPIATIMPRHELGQRDPAEMENRVPAVAEMDGKFARELPP